MTKKHYEMIAAQIAIQKSMTRCDITHKSLNALAINLAFLLKADNPKFNRDMFLTACGIEKS